MSCTPLESLLDFEATSVCDICGERFSGAAPSGPKTIHWTEVIFLTDRRGESKHTSVRPDLLLILSCRGWEILKVLLWAFSVAPFELTIATDGPPKGFTTSTHKTPFAQAREANRM